MTSLRSPRFIDLTLMALISWLCLVCPALAAKIGIYSGTFDPPHMGHLQLIQQAIRELNLDKVYVLPNYSPTEKPGATAFAHRHTMIRLVTLRNPRLQTLATAEFAQAWQAGSEDYMRVLLDRIRTLQGPENHFYQLTGSDSFNKMASYGKLPIPGENRQVVVIPREGYPVLQTPAVKAALQAGTVRTLDVRVEAMSSSWIRDKLAQGDQTALQSHLPDFILDYLLREGLYGTEHPSPDFGSVPVPADYRELPAETFAKISVTQAKPKPFRFVAHNLPEFIRPALLEQPLSLDADVYLNARIPAPVRELIRRHHTGLAVFAGLWPESLISAQVYQGFTLTRVFVPARDRIGLVYALGWRKHMPYLIVTHLFGHDRLYHQLLQYAQLFERAGRPLSDLEIYMHPDYSAYDLQLCQSALQGLRSHPAETAVIGYQGSLNYLLSDLAQFQAREGLSWPGLDQLDRFLKQHPRQLTSPPVQGNEAFPYWVYTLPGPHGPVRVLSFRNTYGSETAVLMRELAHLGVKRFVLFGNGGGLSPRIGLNQVYAPVTVSGPGQSLAWPNRAAGIYPAAHLLKVRSPLEETLSWLQQARTLDLVDSENYDAFRVLHEIPGLQLFAGILVTDRPGELDITHKAEDSPEVIQLKRMFFYRALQAIGLWQPERTLKSSSLWRPLPGWLGLPTQKSLYQSHQAL